MFDIGWSEMLIVAVIAIIVVGPKDLPGMLRTVGRSVRSIRQMANQFQSQFSDALRDAEQQSGLSEIKESVQTIADPAGKSLDPDPTTPSDRADESARDSYSGAEKSSTKAQNSTKKQEVAAPTKTAPKSKKKAKPETSGKGRAKSTATKASGAAKKTTTTTAKPKARRKAAAKKSQQTVDEAPE